MAHEPKLTIYTLRTEPDNENTPNTNRWLFRTIIGETNSNDLEDSYIFVSLFKKFVGALDQQEMYKDSKSKKSITANQSNINEDDVEENIHLNSDETIIRGIIEGGPYGRKRKRRSTINKRNNNPVDISDAITSDFYFLIYAPLSSNIITLMIQSYEGDSIDSAMREFLSNFLQAKGVFKKRAFDRHVPKSIIEDFKNGATVSRLKFSTEIPSNTLLENPTVTIEKNFKVTIEISPVEGDLTYEEYDQSLTELQKKSFWDRTFGSFNKKTGTLRDPKTNKTSKFDLDSDFQVKPVILLSKYIATLNIENIDFNLINKYCYTLLLDQIIPEIYQPDAIRER